MPARSYGISCPLRNLIDTISLARRYMMCLIIYYAFAVPIRVGFDMDPQSKDLENFFTACFWMDVSQRVHCKPNGY